MNYDRVLKYFEKLARRNGYMHKYKDGYSTKAMGQGGIFNLVEVDGNNLVCYESPSKTIGQRGTWTIPDDFE